jgi:hypothetical protein
MEKTPVRIANRVVVIPAGKCSVGEAPIPVSLNGEKEAPHFYPEPGPLFWFKVSSISYGNHLSFTHEIFVTAQPRSLVL